MIMSNINIIYRRAFGESVCRSETQVKVKPLRDLGARTDGRLTAGRRVNGTVSAWENGAQTRAC